MIREGNRSERGAPHGESTKYRETARIYIILAKLSEMISCILVEMDARKIEKGLNGECLNDLREAMGKVSLHVRNLWGSIFTDLVEWEAKGTPQELVAIAALKGYIAGLLGMSEEGERFEWQRLSEDRRKRMLDKLLARPLLANRSLASRLWGSLLRAVRRFRRRSARP